MGTCVIALAGAVIFLRTRYILFDLLSFTVITTADLSTFIPDPLFRLQNQGFKRRGSNTKIF